MVQTETDHLENFEELLDEFKKLPDRVERPPTFMEISGYPHYENVCSNILAFFMDPEEPHGFGTLVLDALTSAANITADERFDGNISVEREVSTEAGNRIDILIESDARAILIENKIYAGASNPFDDYADYLDRRIYDGRSKYKLLLTVFPTEEGREWGFANLNYDEFLYTIRAMLGHYVAAVDTRYLAMFLDFLNTLDNLKKGTRMDQEFIKFLSEHNDEVQNLYAEVKEFKDELRKKVRDLGTLIEVEEYENVRQFFWRQGTALFDDLVHDVRISEELLVAIDTIIDPHGWKILISNRRGDRPRLRGLLDRLDISFAEESSWHFVLTTRFEYDENLDRISPILQDLVQKLATSQEREDY